jgi:hypothetical protein
MQLQISAADFAAGRPSCQDWQDDSPEHRESSAAQPRKETSMIFTLVFLMWTCVLAAAWLATRQTAMAAFAGALVLSVALFVHHITDPLTLSF